MSLKYSSPFLFLAFIALTGLTACNQDGKQGTEDSDSIATGKMTIEALAEDSNEFPDAKLTIADVKTEKVGTDSVKLTYSFKIANYELTKQTMDMHSGECANSDKGQHIHFIMDNQPYQALYNPENTVTLAIDSEHYLLVFLSRSYHLSVKSPDASALVHFKIDKNGKYAVMESPKEPMLFYSRPKGEYAGKDAQNVLLDFYVKNAALAADGYKVKVSVADTTFIINQWQPYFIKNAPMGDLNLKIELLGADGNKLTGENTSAERTVTLK